MSKKLSNKNLIDLLEANDSEFSDFRCSDDDDNIAEIDLLLKTFNPDEIFEIDEVGEILTFEGDGGGEGEGGDEN